MKRKPHGPAAVKTKGVLLHWASAYDVLNGLHFLGREQSCRDWTVGLAEVAHGHDVLDVGCGTGNLTMAAKVRAGDGRVCGIDGASEMIRRAERKAADKRIGIVYRVGLIEDIPFPDNAFDVVLSSLMLHHLPKELKRQGVAEIARVLRPGGRFTAVDLNPPMLGNIEVVADAMRDNGFRDMRRGRTEFWTLFLRLHFLTGVVPAK